MDNLTIDFNDFKLHVDECIKNGFNCSGVECVNCEHNLQPSVITCPTCKNHMYYSVGGTVVDPQFVCGVCGFNKIIKMVG